MIKKFKQYNESIRDKMTGVSDEEVRSKLIEEDKEIYDKLRELEDYIIKNSNIETEFNYDSEYYGTSDAFHLELFAIADPLNAVIKYDGNIFYVDIIGFRKINEEK
jgi:Zn-dependent M16 (insulinase) family peptidase